MMKISDEIGFLSSLGKRIIEFFSPTDPLSQNEIDACVRIQLKNSTDIATLFSQNGGFINWYNRTLSSKPEFSTRGKIGTTQLIRDRFDSFWNQIPQIFASSAVSALGFGALMSIGIQEDTGDLWSNPEEVGRPPNYPGLVYAYEAIPGLKSSYNVNRGLGNWTAFKLFTSVDYVDAHKNLPGYSAAAGAAVSPAWDTANWPQGFSSAVDETTNGFIMQADFYKFRGRGVIQTTGRDDYKVMVDFILKNAIGLNKPALIALKRRWEGLPVLDMSANKLDVIASRSTNQDWENAFAEPAILAAGVAEDSRIKSNYLQLSPNASVLNAGTTTPGSLYFMARKINGGNYPNEVVPMMKSMLRGISGLHLTS